MISQKINYTDLDGNEQQEVYVFNLSQQDFVRLQLRYRPGIQECYEKFVKEDDVEAAYDLLTDVIDSAYGVREGKAFVKNRIINGKNTRPDLANFKFHPAFEQLMVDLMTDEQLLTNFFKNITGVKISDEDFNRLAASISSEGEKTQLAITPSNDQNASTDLDQSTIGNLT